MWYYVDVTATLESKLRHEVAAAEIEGYDSVCNDRKANGTRQHGFFLFHYLLFRDMRSAGPPIIISISDENKSSGGTRNNPSPVEQALPPLCEHLPTTLQF